MLMVEVTDGKKSYSVILQNTKTIKIIILKEFESVAKLKRGDRVLAYLASGGRYFGMAVEETIMEKWG